MFIAAKVHRSPIFRVSRHWRCFQTFSLIIQNTLQTGDYEDVTGESLLDAYNRLNSIDCAYCITHPNGESKWFVNSGTKFHHLTKLIMEQNQQKIKPYQRESFRSKPYRPQKQLNHSIGENDCFFKDNIIYKHMRYANY